MKERIIRVLRTMNGVIVTQLDNSCGLSREADPLRTEINAALEILIEKEERCAQVLKDKKLQTDDQRREFKQRKQGLKEYGTAKKKRTRFSGNA